MNEAQYEKATQQGVTDLEEAAQLLADYPTMFGSTLVQARLMKSLFEKWAKLGRLHLDFLNRTGGQETVELAREINRIGKDLH